VERTKVAIVGFTESRKDAPYDDPEWEVWGLNNLHLYGMPRMDRWFDLHDLDTVRKDAAHVNWLKTTDVPVYMWEPQEEWPTSKPFPKAEVLAAFRPYFTNSISWMVALALLEGFTTIGVWGVDMAQTTEYGGQRPSCEYFLGLAEGRGVEIVIAEQSDLLKTAALYGAEDNTALRRKLEARDEELKAKLSEAEAAIEQAMSVRYQLLGAIESNTYIKNVWTMPEIKREQQETS